MGNQVKFCIYVCLSPREWSIGVIPMPSVDKLPVQIPHKAKEQQEPTQFQTNGKPRPPGDTNVQSGMRHLQHHPGRGHCITLWYYPPYNRQIVALIGHLLWDQMIRASRLPHKYALRGGWDNMRVESVMMMKMMMYVCVYVCMYVTHSL